MSPFVHDVKNFLNQNEIESIKQKVYDLKSSWKHILEYKKYDQFRSFVQEKE